MLFYVFIYSNVSILGVFFYSMIFRKKSFEMRGIILLKPCWHCGSGFKKVCAHTVKYEKKGDGAGY